MMAEWAWGALAHACLYLKRMYGSSSCRIVWSARSKDTNIPGNPHSIVFEPRRAVENDEERQCTCDTIDT